MKYILILFMFALSSCGTADSFKVTSMSMAPNYIIGDKAKIETCTNLCNPTRGKVYAFKYPKDKKITYFKRLIALPGEIVKINGATIEINGLAMDYIKTDKKISLQVGTCEVYFEKFEASNYKVCLEKTRIKKYPEVFIVGENEYFFMGDNRQNSADSRFFGSIDIKDILGEFTKI